MRSDRRCVLTTLLPAGRGARAAGADAGRPVRDPGLGRRVRRQRPARSVILLWLWGAPSHLDTFDMKPDAPARVSRAVRADRDGRPRPRGLRAAAGAGPRADKFSLVRTLHHESTDHGVAGTIGPDRQHGRGRGAGRQAPPSGAVRPSTGAIVGRLHRGASRGAAAALRHPGRSAAPGAEAGRRRGGRDARSRLRPVPPPLRAGGRR